MSEQLSREERAARLAGLRATLVLLFTELYGRDPHPDLLRGNHEYTQAVLDALRGVRRCRERGRST